IRAAADQLSRMPPGLFEEHRQHTPDTALVESALLLMQQRLQFGESLGLDRLWYLIGSGCRGSPWPRRVFEREGLRESDLHDKIERRPEIIVALAGVADDEIGRQSQVESCRAQPL